MAEPSGSAVLGVGELSDQHQVRSLIENHDYGGFGDLDHLKTLPSTNKARLHSKLLNTQTVEGVPFPASIAIVRAILGVDDTIGKRGDGKNLRVEPQMMRFGVYHQQMTQVKEVGFGAMKAAFDRVRFQRDVARSEVDNLRYLSGHIVGGTASLLEWHGYEFYSIPPHTSNAMWDLFEMGNTTWASTKPDSHQYTVIDDVGGEVPAFSPVLVAANRNMEAVNDAALVGRRLPAAPMSQRGSFLHLIVFMGPRTPTPGAYLDMVKGHFNILGDDSHHSRPYAPDEAWLVAYYEPSPRFSAADRAKARSEISYLGLPRDPFIDPWVAAVNGTNNSAPPV